MKDKLLASTTATCSYCGTQIPTTLLKWRVYQPTSKGPVETQVCGKCFILIDILRVLREIQHGKLGRSRIQVVSGDERGRASGDDPSDTTESKNTS